MGRGNGMNWKKRTLKLLNRSQHGQSIILLALGFIALAAFVGLVTDISIMFVRFSTLRRAVDAAAIAAAGQIREGTDYGTVALAARQYIVLHGLQPNRVWVETCETDIAEWRQDNPESNDPPGSDISDLMPETELCDWDNPRKLVRVVAQIDSQTTFLKLIGIDDFVITSSATSETAALDVVLVLDTSTSMAEDTETIHYTEWGLGEPAPGVTQYRDGSQIIPSMCIRDPVRNQPNQGWGGCCNDPGAGAFVHLNTATGEWEIYTDGTVTGLDGNGVPIVVGANGQYDPGEEGVKNNWADGDYSDLLCFPFKQVKDAARNFISRLDFVRGDRVALVTFDLIARVKYPNNNDTLPPVITSEVDAIRTLDKFVGVYVNPNRRELGCIAYDAAENDVLAKIDQDVTVPGFDDLPSKVRYRDYAWTAQCTNTNIGDGIRTANAVLTNPDTIRRNAVWVAIILTDGAANASYQNATGQAKAIQADATGNPVYGAYVSDVNYGDFGFCPWYTFCAFRPRNDPFNNFQYRNYAYDATEIPDPITRDLENTTLRANETWRFWSSADSPWVLTTRETPVTLADMPGSAADTYAMPSYTECNDSREYLQTVEPQYAQIIDSSFVCNDGNPLTRHFCLQWSNNQALNGAPTTDPECSRTGRYDADDYARDMADWAGLIEVAPGVPGNFIAMFSIGFNYANETNQYRVRTASALLRYIADAGDNGVIDRNLEQDWRDNKILNYGTDGNGPYPASFGGNDPCFGAAYDADPIRWCGQFYYANNLQQLEAVFEAIASRLFSRLAR